MTKKITSLKGREIDLGALRESHGATRAIGNAKMNARGDIVGRGGVIVKSKETVIRDYYDNNPKAVSVTSVSLKDISDEVMMTPAEAIAALEAQAAKVATPAAPKRKIKDED